MQIVSNNIGRIREVDWRGQKIVTIISFTFVYNRSVKSTQ